MFVGFSSLLTRQAGGVYEYSRIVLWASISEIIIATILENSNCNDFVKFQMFAFWKIVIASISEIVFANILKL